MNLTYLILLLFQAALLISAGLLVTWLWSLKLGNAGIVGVVWCALFTPLVLSYAGLGDGAAPRKEMIALMVCAWSIRLTTHLYRRVRSQHPHEDPRYAELRRGWGENAEGRFLSLFLLQSALCLLLSVPFAWVCLNPHPGISAFEIAGGLIWVVGLIGEASADQQLERFKSDPANRGRALDTGLWKYSRHPNYFFEWLVWCGYFVFALGTPWGWIAIYCPVIMYYVLTRATGIPMVENQALQSRGDSYRAYQERTNAFFLWLPRS